MINPLCPNCYNNGEPASGDSMLITRSYYRTKPPLGIAIARKKMVMLVYEFECLKCGIEMAIDFLVVVIRKPSLTK